MSFLHGERVGIFNRPVVHGDLKAGNVFLAPSAAIARAGGPKARFTPKIGVRSVKKAALTLSHV